MHAFFYVREDLCRRLPVLWGYFRQRIIAHREILT